MYGLVDWEIFKEIAMLMNGDNAKRLPSPINRDTHIELEQQLVEYPPQRPSPIEQTS